MNTPETDYHQVATNPYWTDKQIFIRLGEITLNIKSVPRPSGEFYALDKEMDCLVFEQSIREKEQQL